MVVVGVGARKWHACKYCHVPMKSTYHRTFLLLFVAQFHCTLILCVTAEDAHGHQPLVYAIHHGHDEVAKVISERLEKVEKDKKAEFDRVCPECAIM